MNRSDRLLTLFVASALVVLSACEQKLDAEHFHRRAEKSYVSANPGFSIRKRREMKTYFVRGDQLIEWDTAPLFEEYQKAGSKGAYFDDLEQRLTSEAQARRMTLAQADKTFIPIIKSGNWVQVQDLGAIGPSSKRDEIRPWRKKIAEDVFVLLAIPEEHLGYRYVSMAEISEAKQNEDELLTKALANLETIVGSSTGAVPLESQDGKLQVLDLPNVDGVSGRVLSPEFRREMTARFGLDQLGAAVPNRDVLIVFDPDSFTTVKPIRARTHELYDSRNHPGFRGLLAFDKDKVWVLEPANPEKKKAAKPE